MWEFETTKAFFDTASYVVCIDLFLGYSLPTFLI